LGYKMNAFVNKSASTASHGRRDELVNAIKANILAAIKVLAELLKHANVFGRESSELIRKTVQTTGVRLNREEFFVAIVGEMKAGKSTFLNAILGAPVLSTAKRESTATVTYIRKSDDIGYTALMISGQKQDFVDSEAAQRDELLLLIKACLNELAEYGHQDRQEEFSVNRITLTLENGVYALPQNVIAALNKLPLKAPDLLKLKNEVKTSIPVLLLAKKSPWYLRPFQIVLAFFYRKTLLSYHDLNIKSLDATLDDSLIELQRIHAERFSRFISEVQDLTDMNKQGNQVIQLDLKFPALRLPPNIVLMDTPGVNTSSQENEQRAWRAIKESADGCLLVSSTSQAVSESTKAFIREVKDVVPHILLVLTKVDELLDSSLDDDMDAHAQLEEVRKIATTRFAKEVGRSSKDIFSIAVAARTALVTGSDTHGLKEKFDHDLTQLFDLLSTERAMAVCAYAKVTTSKAISQVKTYESDARQVYQKRLQALQDQRLPAVKDFIQKSMETEDAAIIKVGSQIATDIQPVIDNAFKTQIEKWKKTINQCESKAEVKELIAKTSRLLQDSLKEIDTEIQLSISKMVVEKSVSIENRLSIGLQDKYRIVDSITGGHAKNGVRRVNEITNTTGSLSVANEMSSLVDAHQGVQVVIGAGGAALGAVIGSFIAPGIGTAVGAGIGALLGLLSSLDSIKADCIKKIEETLGGYKVEITRASSESSSKLADAIRSSIKQWFTKAVEGFQSHIDHLINEQRREYQKVESELKHLLSCVKELQSYSDTTDRLAKELAEISLGLCIS
jgi:tRNA U34 5-carboxymethylaminomethyl modifying GTPase MnmE/TrmE